MRDYLLAPHHEEELIRGGIDRSLAESNAIHSLSNENVAALTGVRPKSDCYAIPYFDHRGNPIMGLQGQYARYRVHNPGDKRKYIAPAQDSFHIFTPKGFSECMKTENNGEQPLLVITEGEKKAIVAVHHGIATVAIGGVTTWHDPNYVRDTREDGRPVPLGGRTPLHPELMDLLSTRRDWRICVLADSDASTNQQVMRAMRSLAQAICVQVECEAVQYAHCPSSGDKKQGLDDWILAAGKSSVRDMLNSIAVGKVLPGWWVKFPSESVSSEGDILYYRLENPIKGGAVPRWYCDKEVDESKDKGAKFGGEDAESTRPKKFIVREHLKYVPALFFDTEYCVYQVENGVMQMNNPHHPPKVYNKYTGIADTGREVSVYAWGQNEGDGKTWTDMGFRFASAKNNTLPLWMSMQAASARACRHGVVKKRVCVAKKGWVRDAEGAAPHYLYGNRIIAPKDAAITLEVMPSASSSSTASIGVGVKGDFSVWRDMFMEALDNPGFAVIAGFAASAPLLGLMPRQLEPGLVHMNGGSSKGKSAAQLLIASMIGSAGKAGDQGAYTISWRATDNGLEAPLEARNDSMVVIDELHLLPKGADVLSLLYMATNGAGKSRMTKDIETRIGKSWRTQIISSGEEGFLSKLRESGWRGELPGGLQFRIIEIAIDLMPIWTDLDRRIPDPDARSKKIEQWLGIAGANHGHLWDRMIREILMDETELASLREREARLSERLGQRVTRESTPIFRRRLKHVSASLMGLSLILKVCQGDPEHSIRIIKAAEDWAISRFWSANLMRVTGSEEDDIAETVKEWLMANMGRLFFPGGDTNHIKEIAGWVKGDGEVFLMLSGVDIIAQARNMDRARIKAALLQAGWVEDFSRPQKNLALDKAVYRGMKSPPGWVPMIGKE